MQTWQTVLLGVIEGLTEFIPVSSTGHLLLTEHFLGVKPSKRVFEVLIQLGAVLALLTVYSARLWQILVDLPRDPGTRRFVAAIVLAFLPAAVVGVLLHKIIKEVLFESPLLVCVTLIVGGVILLLVDRLPLRPSITEASEVSPLTALKIGACQCLALIPGVSRSGSTIVGAMLLGLSKRAAAEFSFFLAMPTMAGAFAYDLYKSYGDLDAAAVQSIAIGFAVAFVAGVVVVRYLLEFVSRYGFAPFAWWRIILGGIGLGAILVLG
ncbi:MAG: undecaprenyl-diphosphate phosphatase [Hyphomicrobiaceae bacterium]